MYTSQGTIDKSNVLTQYAPLVRRLALQMMARLPASVDMDDLIQAGMVGLLDAFSRYQDNRGAQFETFASQRIRGAMIDELRRNDWAPRALRQSSRSIDAAVHTLEQKLGRAPAEREIAQQMGIPLEAYQQLLQEVHGCQLVYFEDFAHEDQEGHLLGGPSRVGGFSQRGDACPLEALIERGFRHRLVEAIDALPEREKLLMSLYYEQELNLREIGAVMDVSESRVSQLHSQAISRLRARMSDIL